MRVNLVLNGRYRLDDRLGFGGMGEVWRGFDVTLKRPVAVKVIRGDLDDEEAYLARFRQEARTLASLSVPGAVAIFDYGVDESDAYPIPFLVMEYVVGRTLGRLVADEKPLEPGRVAAMITDVATTLGVAHDAGIVHRDVKPGNIIVGADGTVTVVDFGIAYTRDQTRHTGGDGVMGTLSYSAPEQLRGLESDGEPFVPGPQSDVYSLGVVAYECLAGERPFRGGVAAIVAGHLNNPPPPLPGTVPPAIAEVVNRALDKDPARRYRNGTEMAVALADAARQPNHSSSRLLRSFSRRTLITAGSLAVALPAAGIVGLLMGRDDPGSVHGPDPTALLADGRLLGGSGGVIYRLGDDGDLQWFRHTDPDNGEPGWATGSGRTLKSGLTDIAVVASYGGVIYLIDTDGKLFWYRHTDLRNGAGGWSSGSGTELGDDFGRYQRLLPGSDGAFYVVGEDGRLFWFKHTSPDFGSDVGWDDRSGWEVGSGWNPGMARLIGSGDDVFYIVRSDGSVSWMRSFGWDSEQAMEWKREDYVVLGFDRYDAVVAGGDGVVYARDSDGLVHWYRHLSPDEGAAEWAPGEGKAVTGQ